MRNCKPGPTRQPGWAMATDGVRNAGRGEGHHFFGDADFFGLAAVCFGALTADARAAARPKSRSHVDVGTPAAVAAAFSSARSDSVNRI